MNPSMHPTMRRLVATQALRTPRVVTATVRRAVPQLAVSINNSNNNNELTKPSPRAQFSLQSQTSVEPQLQHRHSSQKKDITAAAADTDTTTPINSDYYSTSSFESSLNQVLRLELDCPSRNSNSHHETMETCIRDLFGFERKPI